MICLRHCHRINHLSRTKCTTNLRNAHSNSRTHTHIRYSNTIIAIKLAIVLCISWIALVSIVPSPSVLIFQHFNFVFFSFFRRMKHVNCKDKIKGKEIAHQIESRNIYSRVKNRNHALMFFLYPVLLSVFRQSQIQHTQQMHIYKHSPIHTDTLTHTDACKFNYNNGFYYFQFYVILIVLFNMHFIRLRHFGWLHFFTLLCVWTWKNRTRKKNEQSERASERTGRRVHE